MRIPITMCHGIRADHAKPLTVEHLDQLISIASDMGFQSIDYDELARWRDGSASLPERPIMIDFDHPVKSMRYEVREVLDRYGFKGNLFIYTRPYDDSYSRSLPWDVEYEHMSWDEIGELTEDGANARLGDTKTGPRTIWLGPEAARLLSMLPRPEGAARVFPEDITSNRLYSI